MHTKRVLLASSALALLAGAGEAQADGLYLSVFGGANWQGDSSGFTDTSGTESFRIHPDTGFVLGGAVGTKLTNWAQGLRAEVEVSYRRNDLQGDWTISTGSTGGIVDGNMSTFAIMANAWYDFDFGWKAKPYIGGGAGWARTRVDAAEVTLFNNTTPTTGLYSILDHEDSGFAWQLGLGFNYEAAPGVNVGLGYRYFRGPEISWFFEGKSGAYGRLENENHSVMFNLNVDIN